MRHQIILLALATFLSSASAVIVPTAATTEFPACAVGCQNLVSVQTTCSPPSVPETNGTAYGNCFCKATSLQSLYYQGDGVCVSECTDTTDRQKMQQWFILYCNQIAQGVDPATATTAAGTAASTTTAAATSTATENVRGSTEIQEYVPYNSATWLQNHWASILMIILIAIALGGIGFLAVWWRKRQDRKRAESGRLSELSMAEKEGPYRTASEVWSQNQDIPDGYGQRGPAAAAAAILSPSENKKGATAEVDEIGTEATRSRSKSSRPRPSELDIEMRAADRRLNYGRG